jgi:hypothetical protein
MPALHRPPTMATIRVSPFAPGHGRMGFGTSARERCRLPLGGSQRFFQQSTQPLDLASQALVLAFQAGDLFRVSFLRHAPA